MANTARTETETQLDLPAGAFPFASRFVEAAGAHLHYIDEGAGPLLLFGHGNPTWSVLYRDVIMKLRDRFRCVAFDLPGFGLSAPPPGFDFLPKNHARVLAAGVEALDLRDATLIAHDWGGPIGIGAARLSGRISRLCLGNTYAWPVNGDFHFEWFSRLFGGPLGRFGTERFKVFVNVFMPTTFKRRRMTAQELKTFRAPFQGLQARRPMHVFPREITASGPWLSELEAYVREFRGPAHFLWPDGDVAFRAKELAHWRSLLPQAEVTPMARCGHFFWLEAPDECATAISAFMGR